MIYKPRIFVYASEYLIKRHEKSHVNVQNIYSYLQLYLYLYLFLIQKIIFYKKMANPTYKILLILLIAFFAFEFQ